MIGQNIKYLRNKFKLSQQELSEKLSVPRSSLSDYERGHTQVGIETLIKIADIFDVKIDDILRSNLSHRDLEIIRNKDLRVLAISVDVDNNSNIELVETKAEAGYLESFADPEYIRDLPKIAFPNIPQGTYRGFEIHGDSMLPMETGSIVICAYVENLKDIKPGKTYVIISKSEGVVYKRVKNDSKTNQLMLLSDNEAYLPYAINYADIAEVWQYYAHLSFTDSKHTFNSMLEDKLQDIQKKINDMHKHLIS